MFYHNKEWKKIRLEILNRDNFTCQYCKLINPNVMSNRWTNQVHHIYKWKIYPWLKFERTNLISLCPPHHKLADNGNLNNFINGEYFEIEELLKGIAKKNEC